MIEDTGNLMSGRTKEKNMTFIVFLVYQSGVLIGKKLVDSKEFNLREFNQRMIYTHMIIVNRN